MPFHPSLCVDILSNAAYFVSGVCAFIRCVMGFVRHPHCALLHHWENNTNYDKLEFKHGGTMKHIFTIVSFTIFITGIAFGQLKPRHILLEEFSTAQCGFCPDGDLVAAQLVKDYPSVIWVTHHAGFGVDSMSNPASVTIANAFTTFAPGACLDRGDYPVPIYTMPPYIAVSRQRWDSLIIAHIYDPPAVNLTITNGYDAVARTLNCTVEAAFTSAPTPGDLRLNIYLVEDNVTGIGKGYDQKNYFNGTPGHPYYQKGDSIVGYVHERVVRSVPGGAWGVTGVIPSAPEAGKIYSYTFSNVPISQKWKDGDMDVIAFVSYFNNEPKLRQVLHSNVKKLTDAPSDVDPTAGVAQSPHVTAYPNPATNRVSLSYDAAGIARGMLIITDRTGRTISSTPLHGDNKVSVISVENMPGGVYFYRIVGIDGKMLTGNFSIAR